MHGARFLLAILAFVGTAAGLPGCASTRKPGEFSAQELLAAACPEIAGKVVAGSFWTKIRSPELNGQFPATMRVDFPARLAVEVTNLIGAPQAWLRIENGKTELRLSPENEKKYGGAEPAHTMLGGLPLEHASRLFAGGVPCPGSAVNFDTQLELGEDGALLVQSEERRTRTMTRYVYRFERYLGKPWVSQIRLHSSASASSVGEVDIRREEPVSPDGAPRRWSASSRRGEIQVRWKDRNVVSSAQGKQ